MNIKKFNEFRDLVNNAKCPKDVFGEVPQKDKKTIAKVLKEKWQYFEKISKDPKDGSEEYQKNFLLSNLTTLTVWAGESLRDGTYDQKLTYRVKLKISVKKHEEEKMFFVENCPPSICVYFDKLDAVGFEGYMRMDKITLTRNGLVTHSGLVDYYGTHGASEYFYNFLEPGHASEVMAKNLEEGDVIEVETLRYSLPKDFAKRLIGFYGVSKSLDSALSKNNGSLDGEQLLEVMTNSKSEFKKSVSKQKVFVLKS